MIKDIVVQITGSNEDKVRLAYAEAIARTFEAHLIGLQIHQLPELIAYTDPTGSAFLQTLIKESTEQAEVITKPRTATVLRMFWAMQMPR